MSDETKAQISNCVSERQNKNHRRAELWFHQVLRRSISQPVYQSSSRSSSQPGAASALPVSQLGAVPARQEVDRQTFI